MPPTQAMGFLRRVTISRKAIDALWLLGAAVFALILNGAIPFHSVPAKGQAVWVSGFAVSLFDSSNLSLYATQFGIPEPAPLVFGLSGAIPMSLLIGAGIHAADAYSTVVALWLIIAFVAAWRIGTELGVSFRVSALYALVWLSMPIIWAHGRHSMLSVGFALLPFYFWASSRLFARLGETLLRRAGSIILHIGVCIVAVFMDGYSFMMFATGGILMAGYLILRNSPLRRRLILFSLPVFILGLAISYSLYAAYIGRLQFEQTPIEFFRIWGVDVAFLVIPSLGVHWLWDLLGLSVSRTSSEWFGTPTVWRASFSVPFVLFGLAAWCQLRRKSRFATGVLAVALFGIYMSLGPSLKVNSKKPEALPNNPSIATLMPPELAFATGNSLLSENIPGFKNMRAAYRWLALALVAFWLLIVLRVSKVTVRAQETWAVALASGLILSNLPDIREKWRGDVENRQEFLRIDELLLSDMRQVLSEGELVAFLPYQNSFLINYFAPRLRIRTYNIGGDKNLQWARNQWPSTMRNFPMGRVDRRFADRVLVLLARSEADAVVLPFIDMLWTESTWLVPADFRDELTEVVKTLQRSEFVNVDVRQNYAVVRLTSEARDEAMSGGLELSVAAATCIAPYCLERNGLDFAELPSQVGRMSGTRRCSNNRAGFLVFGPYLSMNSGAFQLTVTGSAASAGSEAWVDVTSRKGRVPHARVALSETREAHTGVLASTSVLLEEDVDDLEVRIFVGPTEEVCLDSYRLEPMERTMSTHAKRSVERDGMRRAIALGSGR